MGIAEIEAAEAGCGTNSGFFCHPRAPLYTLGAIDSANWQHPFAADWISIRGH
jgi:hypothetical protein